MPIRMQQRRGTASQWTSGNPILAAGEIGFETDTGKFKIGDGVKTWSVLNYFTDANSILGGVSGVDLPSTLDTLNELAAALNDDPNFFSTIATNLSTHEADSTNVHGIANTANLVTLAGSQTLTNKSVDLANNTLTGTISQFNSALSDADFATVAGSQTLTNKTVNLSDNTLIGTTAQFNTALSDGNFATLAGTEILTNKTISSENNTVSITSAQVSDFNEAAQDAIGNSVGTGLTYTDSTGAISVDTSTIQARVTDVSDTEIGYLNGVTSAIQDQLDDKAELSGAAFTGSVSAPDFTVTNPYNGIFVGYPTQANGQVSLDTNDRLYLSSSGGGAVVSGKLTAGTVETPNLTIEDSQGILSVGLSVDAVDGKLSVDNGLKIQNDLIVDGDFTVNGTNFAASATSIVIEDNLVQLAHQNAANTVDLGIVVGYNDGTAKHAGIVRDVSASTWKLFKDVTTEPTTTVDFTQGSLDNLELNAITATSATIGNVSNTEIQFLDGVTSSIQTQLNSKTPELYTFTADSGTARTLALVDNFASLRFTSGSAVTVTVPTDASVAFPVGSYIELYQWGAGQVSVVAGTPATTSIRSTDSQNKLRTQYSSAVLIKVAANEWLLTGDLTA